MSPDYSSQEVHGARPSPTVLEAKRELLEWGVRADAELHEQVTDSISAIKSGAKGLIPWATLGATGIGLLLRLVRGGSSSGAKKKSKSSLFGTVIRGAIDVLPIVNAMMQARK